MAEADWTYLNDGLDIATVDRGVTAGIARPPGGGSFLYAFNSLAAVAGAVALFAKRSPRSPAGSGEARDVFSPRRRPRATTPLCSARTRPDASSELAPGDHAEVTQTTDLTGVKLVRALLRLRVPASTPAGLAWEASILVDGTKLARMRAKPGRERLVTDLAANVSKLTGTHTVGLRLELVTA